MWILKGPKGETYYLVPGKEHIVGRKDGDLVFADDQSISRKHSVISVNHPTEHWDDPDKLPVVKITEPGSKYGTTINPDSCASKMDKNSTEELHDGDTIKFGLQWNSWRLVHEPLVVVMSTLSGLQKKEVRDIVGKAGGHIVSNWQLNCTHLTMSNFTMTVKAIIALAHGKAIVVPEYWRKFLAAVENKQELPDYKEFIPPLAETIINKNEVSFLINPERKRLFNGKEFLFFTLQQHNDHSCLVTAAGGTTSVLNVGRIPENKLLEPHIIVMQHVSSPSCPVSQTPQASMEVITFLQSNGKRVIPVSEIGLAILHCSTEKYCNPNFSFASAMLSSNRHSVCDIVSQLTLAAETLPSQRPTSKTEEKLVIPDSGTVSKRANRSKKPTLLDVPHSSRLLDFQEKNVKGTEEHNGNISSFSTRSASQKRYRSPDDGGMKQPSKKTASTKSKSSGLSLKPKSDDEDGLFDFANDNAEINSDEDDVDNMFTFKDPLPVKIREEDGENTFSFQDFQNVGKQESLPLFSKCNTKRKLSISDDSEISDRLQKKLALQNNSIKSKSDFDFEDESQQGAVEFLSAPSVKKEKSDEYFKSESVYNSSIVVVKSLVTSQSSLSHTSATETSVGQSNRNFKKFRKAHTPSASSLPRVITGRDMVPYSNNTSAAMSSMFNNYDDDDDDDDGSSDEKDDWAFQTVSQKKNKGRSRRL